jgi:chromosome segregation ATPase
MPEPNTKLVSCSTTTVDVSNGTIMITLGTYLEGQSRVIINAEVAVCKEVNDFLRDPNVAQGTPLNVVTKTLTLPVPSIILV